MSWLQLIKQLDIPGIVTLIPGVICLLLALQWGGSIFSWKNVRIIVLLIMFGILAISFIAVQILTPKTRTIPSSLFQSRSIGFTTWYTGCTFSLFVVMIYYLPIWFQGVQRVSAFESGIRTTPLIVAFIGFALISGVLTTVVGPYTPFMIASSIITPIGVGLLTTLRPTSPSSHWIGYQVLFGAGIGIGIQQPLLVIQTVLLERDVPVGTALITLTQSLCGAVFVAVAQNIFQTQLAGNIQVVLPDFDTTQIQRSGATTLVQGRPESEQAVLAGAYSKSVTQTFYIAIALGALSLVGSLGTEWRSVKKKKGEDGGVAEDFTEEKKAGAASTS